LSLAFSVLGSLLLVLAGFFLPATCHLPFPLRTRPNILPWACPVSPFEKKGPPACCNRLPSIASLNFHDPSHPTFAPWNLLPLPGLVIVDLIRHILLTEIHSINFWFVRSSFYSSLSSLLFVLSSSFGYLFKVVLSTC
jgi:hypothetical protein